MDAAMCRFVLRVGIAMGGYGSGRRFGAKRQVESCLALSSPRMLQNNLLDLEVGDTRLGDFSWTNRLKQTLYNLCFELARVSVGQIRLDLYGTKQVIYMHSTAMRFGGLRWWFVCPRCFRRRTKLYRPPNAEFLCHACHDLTYQSSIEGKSTAAAFARLGVQHGLSAAEVKEIFAGPVWARSRWRRRRDRRPDYKGRGWRLRESRERLGL
jgi:hypothetical protein